VQGNVEAGRIGRHFGLDWLRIGAFAILILYHIGLYFAPGHWHFRVRGEVRGDLDAVFG
jgi:hypothetical protein